MLQIYKNNNNKIILFNRVVVNYNKKIFQTKFNKKINLINLVRNKYNNNNKIFLLICNNKIIKINNNKLHFNQ